MTPIKSIIVQSKDKNLLKKSSSGAMFAELAKYVLYKNGVVFGCAMNRTDDGFEVKHIYIEDEKELYRLQGSKYVQSSLENTIKQAKEFLDSGRLVLFSGTPCQIAGLKAYLKEDYKNLITVDLSCEGTPPLKIFNDYIKYLEEKVIKHKIVDFKFRSKKYFGWSTFGFVAIYEKNGKSKEKTLPRHLSAYFTYFLKGYLLQDRCFECKYTGLNRIGDITIADAWGAEKEYPELTKKVFNTKKGLSLVLINSLKGEEILDEIKDGLTTSEIDIKKLRKHNHPLRHPSVKAPERARYLDEYNKNGYDGLERLFKKEIGKIYTYYIIKLHTPKFIKRIIKLFIPKKETVDCLLYTMFAYPNYGSLLTAYALYKTIENLGYNSKLIFYNNMFGYNKKFAKSYFKLTKRCYLPEDFDKLNKITNTFILGSDNLLNLNELKLNSVAQSLLNFVHSDKKKLMISGSIGSWDGNIQNEKEKAYFEYLLKSFDYVSTREEYAEQIFEQKYDCPADWINDPVFFIDKQEYINLAKKVKNDYTGKIMKYVLYPTEKTREIVEFCQKKTNKEVVEFRANTKNITRFSKFKNKSVENWLAAVINSDLIITDSFHCVVFALMFGKSLICVKNKNNTVRFTSLLNRLGIYIPMIETAEEINSSDFSYDYDLVKEKMEEIKQNGIKKIEENLLKPKKYSSENKEMEEYNLEFIKQNLQWWKRNKFIYYAFIRPFAAPVKRIILDLRNEYNRTNKKHNKK